MLEEIYPIIHDGLMELKMYTENRSVNEIYSQIVSKIKRRKGGK